MKLSTGTRIKILTGDLKGSIGYTTSYYKDSNTYGVRFLPVDCTDRTLQPSADGIIHWVAHRSEFEPLDTTVRIV